MLAEAALTGAGALNISFPRFRNNSRQSGHDNIAVEYYGLGGLLNAAIRLASFCGGTIRAHFRSCLFICY
jgi:hypothetical protein